MNRFNFTGGLEGAWTDFMTFVPKLLLAGVILLVGYFLAKLLSRLLGGVLHRVGFDRLTERGGIKQALARTNYEPSGLLAKLVFYALMLFVLQFAFSAFGPNPVSALLTMVVAYLPNIFVAVVIVVVAGAIAAAVKDLLRAALGSLSYGRVAANAAAAIIYATGIFAALSQLQIAPAIVNGIFYAVLAIIAGSAIVAIGGAGIVPMRARWEKALDRLERETPHLRETPLSTPVTQPQGEWKENLRKAA